MGKHRDACIKSCGNRLLVITSDNAATIGQAPRDKLVVDPYVVGYLTARVAAMEAVALGANPVVVSSTLSFNYRTNQGQRLTQGVLALMKDLGLSPHDLTGSCETNFPADVTCVGITVASLAEPEGLLLHQAQAGDCCYLLGMPKVGLDVLQTYSSLIKPATVQKLTGWHEVHEVLPIGSHGIQHELREVANAYQLGFCPYLPSDFGWSQSAGPATCLLVIGKSGLEARLQTLGEQVTLLGHLQ